MRIAWFIIAIFTGRFFASAVFYPQIDGDLGWQRWLGARIAATHALPRALGPETFTAPGAHWTPQEWLFSLLAYESGSSHWALFAGFCALCAGAALAIVAWNAVRRRAHPYAAALCTALAGVALLESFGVRVQVLSWPLLAAFLFFLEADGAVAYVAVAVAAVWSNVHASVMLAPVLAAIACAGSYLDSGWSASVRRTAVIALLSALATCANPLGAALPQYALALFSSSFKSIIREWQPTNLGDGSFALGALPLLLCIFAFGIHGEHRWRDRFVLVTTALLMFSAGRNIALFALAAAPLAARALTTGVPYFRDRLAAAAAPVAKTVSLFEMGGALVLAAAIGGFLAHRQAADPVPDSQPLAAIAAIQRLPGTRNVLCADFAWCSFLLVTPRDRVFLDGRADPYPQSVWTDFETIVRVHSDWLATLHRRNVDVIVARRTSVLEAVLARTPEWSSLYVDHDVRVWVRAPTNAATRSRTVSTASR